MIEIYYIRVRIRPTRASSGTLSDALGNQSGKSGVLITRLRNRARVIQLQGWRRRLFTLREGYCAGRYYN